jgi:tRNA-dihydrouridine synthase B
MRTGWSPEHRNGPEIARIAQQAGVSALAVHGRTRACAYRGDAEYETIREIKLAVDIPVFANGDVLNPLKAEQVLNKTGADAVMIGRGARGRPWLLKQVNDYLRKKILPANPPMRTQRATIIDHLENTYRFYGEQTGVRVARKHLAWFTEQMVDGAKFRKAVMKAQSTRAQMQITEEYLARRVAGENTDASGQSPPVSATWRRPAERNQPPESQSAKPRLPA